MNMKRLLAAGLCLLLLTGCGAPAGPEVPTEEEGYELPSSEEVEKQNLGAFEAETLDGDTLTQEFFANADLTLINLWGTYCGPCKMEMPTLAKLDKEYDNVQVLGIVIDATKQDGTTDPDQVEVANTLAEAAGVEYPSLIMNQDLAKAGFANMTAVPATVFVDSEGNLVGQGFYGALEEDDWRTVIEDRLGMLE